MNEARVELHKKFAIPATCLVFAVLGLPIALAQRSSGRSWGYLISLVFIAIQYFLLTAGEQMADRGRISAATAMWSGNAGFAALALLLLLFGGRWSWDARRLLDRFRRSHPSRHVEDAIGEGSPQALSIAPSRTPLPAIETSSVRRWGSFRPLALLDLYLFRALLPISLLVILSLSFLFALFTTLNLVDDYTRGGAPTSWLLGYIGNVMPQFLVLYIIPVGLCVSTLITFALLSRTRELTALRAAGVGPLRVSAAFVAVALVAAALSFGAQDSVLPAMNQKAVQIRDQIRGRSPRSYRQPERRWVFGSLGDLVTFSSFDREQEEMLDLAVLRFQPNSFQIKERLFAARAAWTPQGWLLSDGWRREFTPSGEVFQPFGRRKLEGMDPPEYFVQEWKAPDQMSLRELRAYVADMGHRGHETRDLRVELYRKTALPAVCVVMVLIALAFALRIEGRGPIFGLGVALLIVTAYFFLMQAAGKLGEVGVLPPFLAAWSPNLIFGGSGAYLMVSSRW